MIERIEIKSVHVDFLEGVQRIRTKIYIPCQGIKKTHTLIGDDIKIKQDIYKQLNQIYPDTNIKDELQWPKL